MPAKTILTVLFLISLGVVVMLGLRALPQRVNASAAIGVDEILVAAAALPSGTLLRAKDVVWQPIAEAVQPGQIQRPRAGASDTRLELAQQAGSEVFGAALRAAVESGRPITRGAIVKPGDRDFLQVVLAARERAIAIPVTTSGASTGLLYPGDRVDVILTQTFKNDPPLTHRSVSETVVENLRVLAIDAPDTKPAGAGNSFGRTVTLEVTPEQAESINVAAELGKLSLTLRSISAIETPAAIAGTALGNATKIKPIWAGDVSPALGDAVTLNKDVAAKQPVVEIIHGSKAVAVKLQ